jgi:uncharacterized protein
MKYLLDVNALVALGFLQHEFHNRIALWTRELCAKGAMQLATCSITELGFVRVLAQVTQYDFTVSHARALLVSLKKHPQPAFTFLTDDHDISRLPTWVKSPRQTTDGHLGQRARANAAVLATLDKGIPGSFLIPQV